MKHTYIHLLFFFNFCFSQNPIEIKIDAITSSDSIPSERKFKISYHIENRSDKEISFFLNPTILIPNHSASMSRNISYKLFQNNEELDIDGIFMAKKFKDFRNLIDKTNNQKERDSIIMKFLKDEGMDIKKDVEESKKDEDYLWKKSNKELLETIFKLNPHQKITFTKTLSWDKTRYYKIEDNEYYISEDIPHYMEISINLMKEEFKDDLTKEEFQTIMNNPNFIKGWFTSNKMEMNFRN